MTDQFFQHSLRWRLVALCIVLAAAAACGPKKNVIPQNAQPDRYLMDRANEAVAHAAAHSGPFRMTVIQPR